MEKEIINNLKVNSVPKSTSIQKEPILEGELTGYASIDKPWMKWYNKENSNINPKSTNCFDYLLDVAKAYGNSSLLNYYGRNYSIKDIKEEVEKNIIKFTSMGLKQGDIVSFIMIDVPEVLFLWLALTKMGVITNLIKFDEVPERINYMINLTNSKYLFVSEVPFILKNVRETLNINKNIDQVVSISPIESVSKKMIVKNLYNDISNKLVDNNDFSKIKVLKTLANELQKSSNMISESKEILKSNSKFISYSDWSKQYSNSKKMNIIENGGDNISVIVYTGGTTGQAKGVKLTNDNLISSAHGFKFSEWGFDYGKTSLNILPPAIAYYFNATYNMICCGVNTTLISNFSVDEYPNLIQKYKPNIFLSGPILLKLVAESSKITDASFMTSPISGGDKLHIDEEAKFNEFVKNNKGTAIVHQGYGESECTAAATYSKKNASILGTIGIPMINVDVAIFDYDTMEELKYGQEKIGEICISGPTVMSGYYENSDETNKILRKHSDGRIWLHSDDFGYMDQDGRVFHRGRAKRMLTRKGNKVWLGLLEEHIKKLDSVYDCCCVKMSDDVEREVPVAHIVFNPNIDDINRAIKDVEEVIKNKCSEIYLPKYFVIKDDLPYTEVNKKKDFKSLENEEILNPSEYCIDGNIIRKKEKVKNLNI